MALMPRLGFFANDFFLSNPGASSKLYKHLRVFEVSFFHCEKFIQTLGSFMSKIPNKLEWFGEDCPVKIIKTKRV